MIILKMNFVIVREDEVNYFKVKYRNHTKNQLKQTRKKLKSDKTAENTSETIYVSKLLRSGIQNNQSKTNESSSLNGIDHDSKINNHFWKYVKLIFHKPAMVFPQFDKDACYQFFKNCFSRSKINRFNIPAWMPQYNNPKRSFNLQPPSYRDISKIISKMKLGWCSCLPFKSSFSSYFEKMSLLENISDVSYSKAFEGSKYPVCLEKGSYHINL